MMDKERAKELLRLHPPSADAGDDPEMREAFDRLAEDDELKAWYESERQSDLAIARALKSIEPPAGLKEKILAGGRAAPVVPFPWTRVALTAAAAVLLAAMGWGLFVGEGDDAAPVTAAHASPAFLGDLVSYFQREPDYDHFGGDLSDLRARIRDNGGPDANVVFPASLEEMKGFRCRVFKQETRNVALICMERQDDRMHLFVIDKAEGFPSGTDETEPFFTEADGWAFAGWQDSGMICVLATRGSKNTLKPLF